MNLENQQVQKNAHESVHEKHPKGCFFCGIGKEV
jgi:hypothetical protein